MIHDAININRYINIKVNPIAIWYLSHIMLSKYSVTCCIYILYSSGQWKQQFSLWCLIIVHLFQNHLKKFQTAACSPIHSFSYLTVSTLSTKKLHLHILYRLYSISRYGLVSLTYSFLCNVLRWQFQKTYKFFRFPVLWNW